MANEYAISGIDAIRIDSIPQELKGRRQWVAWKAVDQGDGKKPVKVPINPFNGMCAKSNDSNTWGSFDEAVGRATRDRLAGIGFMFDAGSDIVGIDLDDVWDLEKSDFTSEVTRKVCTVFDTYTEVSPSGRGVKLWIRSESRGARCNGTFGLKGELAGQVLEYETYCKGRWFAVTGHALPLGGGQVNERTAHYVQFTGWRPRPEPKPRDVVATSLPAATANVAAEEAMIRAALEFLDCDTEGPWFRAACCLKSWGAKAGDERARSLWDVWSAKSGKYDPATQAERWDRIAPDKGLTVGTLFHDAMEAGYQMGDAVGEDGVRFRVEQRGVRDMIAPPVDRGRQEEFYYDAPRKEYLLRNGRGVWLHLTETQFRKELAAIRARRNFGSQIKQVTVVEAQRYHAKNRPALSIKPFWRLTISLNNETENMMVPPPLDDSLEDKLIILRAHKSPMPMPAETLEQRKAFWDCLIGELPAFLHWLMSWQVPQELKSERFGIAHCPRQGRFPTAS